MRDAERWLRACRAAAAAVERELARLPTRREREPGVGRGEGGDETTAVDAAAEAAVVGVLEDLHREGVAFTLVSEELGERAFGSGSTLRVVVDPIDGSVNAKRGIPFFSVSLAVADGPTMSDVFFGFVRDLGTGEEWTARRGGGAFLDGIPLDGPGPKPQIELLSLEATTTVRVAEASPRVVELAERTRVMGSLALSLCHLAAGRVDAVCSLRAARSVDIAAAQLLVRERGFAVDLPESGFADAPLDVVARSRVVAARDVDGCSRLFAALG